MPTQEVVEIKNGKKVTVERKLYPGYVLVEMVWNQETAHVINSIQGVIKFVGHGLAAARSRCVRTKSTGCSASPTRRKRKQPKEEIPFLDRSGGGDHRRTVHRLQRNGRGSDGGQGQGAGVGVSLFGRPTSVELDYLQLKAILSDGAVRVERREDRRRRSSSSRPLRGAAAERRGAHRRPPLRR